MNKNNLKSELIKIDKKRLKIRKSYKSKLHHKINIKLKNSSDYIFFPKILISKNNEQLRYGLSWHYNGFIIKVDSLVMAVDPGVNFLLRLTESKYNITNINKLYISHLHIDHSADANTLMEYLIRSNSNIEIFAPQSVYETNTISKFHSGEKISFNNIQSQSIDENTKLKFNNININFFPLFHGVECYGFNIKYKDKLISYISDTGYSREIKVKNKIMKISEIKKSIGTDEIILKNETKKKEVQHSDIIICNIDSFQYNKNSKTHLSVLDLLDILKDSNCKKLILSHINPMGEILYEEWGKKISKYIKNETNINTFCSNNNGLKIILD